MAFAAEDDTHPAAANEHASGTGDKALSPLFEALADRASQDAERRAAGTSESDRATTGASWDRERAFTGMERLRAEIVMLSALGAAQKELLLWNRERIKTGADAAVLPRRLCRQSGLTSWCLLLPATFGALRRAPGNPPMKDVSQ